MKANLKTQTFDDWNAANDFMKKLDAKGLEHTAFPVPNSTDYVVAWAELSEDKQSLTIKDWAISDAPESIETHQLKPFNMDIQIGNQTYVDIFDAESSQPVLGLVIEINQGVPALQVDMDGSDCIFRLHKTSEGLLVTPEFPLVTMKAAEPCTLTNNQDLSMIVKHTQNEFLGRFQNRSVVIEGGRNFGNPE
jgi:hypothetical protein